MLPFDTAGNMGSRWSESQLYQRRPLVSHDRKEESLRAKAKWFQSLWKSEWTIPAKSSASWPKATQNLRGEAC